MSLRKPEPYTVRRRRQCPVMCFQKEPRLMEARQCMLAGLRVEGRSREIQLDRVHAPKIVDWQ